MRIRKANTKRRIKNKKITVKGLKAKTNETYLFFTGQRFLKDGRNSFPFCFHFFTFFYYLCFISFFRHFFFTSSFLIFSSHLAFPSFFSSFLFLIKLHVCCFKYEGNFALTCYGLVHCWEKWEHWTLAEAHNYPF